MIDFTVVGRRLREAMAKRGVTRAFLAERARVSEEVLAHLEVGETVRISTAALARLEEQLKLPPVSLWSSSAQEAFDLSLHFRHATVPDFFHADEEAAREALWLARDIEGLGDLLGWTPPLAIRAWFPPAPVGHSPKDDGYARAQRLRDVLHQTGWLISQNAPLPDPLETLVENAFGVPVLERSLQTSRVLAVTVKDRQSGLCAILLNTANTWGSHSLRRRVDIAHEIAHVLFDEPREDIGFWIDRVDDKEKEGRNQTGDPVEKRARAFAAEFLLPRLGLRQLLGPAQVRARTVSDAVDLVQRAREYFKTTIEIAAYHLENLGYIEPYLHEEILRTVPTLAVEEQARRETLLERLTREAADKCIISGMRAREFLGISAWDELPWSAKQ